MWLLRLLAVLLVVAIGAGLLVYVITGKRKFLLLAWRLFQYGIIFSLLVLALMFIERIVLIPA